MSDDEIAADDRVTYAEAMKITSRSHRYLGQRAQSGELRRVGGRRRDPFETWLSRAEVEALALRDYKRGRASAYWMTMTQVAAAAGVARTTTHAAQKGGRLRAQQAACGDWLVRPVDAQAFVLIAKPGNRPQGVQSRLTE